MAGALLWGGVLLLDVKESKDLCTVSSSRAVMRLLLSNFNQLDIELYSFTWKFMKAMVIFMRVLKFSFP